MSSSNPTKPSGTTHAVGHGAAARGAAGDRPTTRRRAVAAMLATALAAATIPAAALVAQAGSVVRGTVTDSAGRAIAGADVLVPQLGWVLHTDSAGRYAIEELDAGRWAVTARHAAHRAVTAVIEVTGRDTVTHAFVLSRVTNTLSQVVVTARQPVSARMAEFERRRASGFGSFLGRDALERSSHRLMSEVMRTVPGISVVAPDPRSRELAIAGRRGAQAAGGGTCYSQMIVDGVRIYAPPSVISTLPQRGPSATRSAALPVNGPPPPDINFFSPLDIEAIEVYAGNAQTPSEYAGPSARCGTVVIWTRDGRD